MHLREIKSWQSSFIYSARPKNFNFITQSQIGYKFVTCLRAQNWLSFKWGLTILDIFGPDQSDSKIQLSNLTPKIEKKLWYLIKLIRDSSMKTNHQ